MSKYILPSLKGYKKSYLKNDIIAGIVVAALTVPVAMGYAEVAGLPPVYGLYASILPVIGYALFCSSRQLIFGIDAAASAITGSMLAMLGVAAQSDQAVALAPMLSLFAGLFLLLFSVFKLGRFASYISRPVMSGFITGISISIMLGQIPKVMELSSSGTDFFGNLESIFGTASQTNLVSLALGIGTIAVVLLGKKYLPKVPMALVVLVAGTAISAALQLDQRGVTITGDIPQGLPPISIPDFSSIPDIGVTILGGLVVAVVVFADSLLDSNSFAIQGKYKLDDNQELRAFGLSNLFASITGASPTSGSVSRTAASVQFKGKTQVVSLVAAGIVLMIVMFLSGLLYYMPQPVLSGIIIAALIGVIDVKMFKVLWRRSRMEWIIWLVSGLCVLVIGVLVGVIIGVILSFIDVIMRITSPPRAYLGVIDGKEGYYDLSTHKQARPVRDDIVIFRFTAPLFFANMQFFQKSILDAAAKKPKLIIVEGSGISYIDTSAADGLKDLLDQLKPLGVDLYFAGTIGRVNQEMEEFGLKDYMNSGHVQKTIGDILSAQGVEPAKEEA